MVLTTPGLGWAAQGAATAKPSAQINSQGAGRTGGPGRGGSPMSPWEWWNDVEVQKELGLPAEKVKNINDVYARRTEGLKPLRDEFTKQLAELDKVTRARTVDEATYALQVMRVESLRSELNKSRTVMLYRLFRELSPEQYLKLQGIRERRDRDRDRGRGGPQPK